MRSAASLSESASYPAATTIASTSLTIGHFNVPRPAKERKGFARVDLKPGETKHVALTLDRRAFSSNDAEAKPWRAEPGEYEVLVGPSSARIDLSGKTTLAAKS